MNIRIDDQSSDLFQLSADEGKILRISSTSREKILESFNGQPEKERFFLRVESFLLSLAHAHNKIMSLSNSRTRLLAHQVESTHRIVSAMRHRFLLADEVGLGKTIEAGLVIKELIYRYGYSRILIAAPASLLFQWQHEMKNKFNEDFVILDRKRLMVLERSGCERPWSHYNRVICSIDFMKQERFREELARTNWDTVIFDEAHRLRRDGQGSTITYQAADVVSKRSRALLLLSATPFRGRLEELYYLVSLLDPDILGPFQSFYQRYCLEGADLSDLRDRLASFVIRRTKKEVGGFTRRMARTIRFDLYPVEKELYDATTEYVVREFNRAYQSGNNATGFVMTVFQKLLDSSSSALLRALERRKFRLEELARGISDNLGGDNNIDMESDELEYLADEDLEDYEKTREELLAEAKTLGGLLELGKQVERNKKGEKLRELLTGLREQGVGKVLIFTQFRTTQDYLVELLYDFRVVIFNGSMSGEEKEEAIRRFREEDEILVATEAGGEGRNMQFCHVMVNYDLPWSPLKIEQRIGRIHRFGQKRDVLIYNFSTSGTVAERVLEVLSEKLRLFEESIGMPDVMLGEIEDEGKIANLFMSMAAGRKTRDDVETELDSRMDRARENFEKLSELTITDRLDFNYDEYYRVTLKERKFSNDRIRDFVARLQDVRPDLQSILGPPHGKTGLCRVPSGEGNIRYGTFDSQKAMNNEELEFLAFGHPAVEALVSVCQEEDWGGRFGLCPVPWHRPFTGFVLYALVACRLEDTRSEVIAVVVDPSGELDEYDLHDLEKRALENTWTGEHLMPEMLFSLEDCFLEGERILEKRLNKQIDQLRAELEMKVDPETERVEESFRQRMKELEEKLDLQEARMKWSGDDMKSAIGRTRNLMIEARRNRDNRIHALNENLSFSLEVDYLATGILTTVTSA